MSEFSNAIEEDTAMEEDDDDDHSYLSQQDSSSEIDLNRVDPLNNTSSTRMKPVVEDENRKFRLEMFNLFNSAFNHGDLNTVYSLLEKYCHPNIVFKAPIVEFESKGFRSIFIFFILLNEVYPDSYVKVIDRRVASLDRPRMSSGSGSGSDLIDSSNLSDEEIPCERVEVIYKFQGTRIFSKKAAEIFRELATEAHLQAVPSSTNSTGFGIDGGTGMSLTALERLSPEEISQVINAKLSSLQRQSEAFTEISYSYILETTYLFDVKQNVILEWGYNLLAVGPAPNTAATSNNSEGRTGGGDKRST